MINLQVKRPVKLPFEKSRLIRAAWLTLESQDKASTCDMSIVVGDDALLKSLNQKYGHHAATTDVLSFSTNEPDPDAQTLYLGDVVISFPRAQEQSHSAGHPLADELQLLVVHGTLHLLGFDHLDPVDKKNMQSRQDEILQQLGIGLKIDL
ncbi:MAG: rRNA maturation RNase YbeY [Acidobacteriaceae bacterium]